MRTVKTEPSTLPSILLLLESKEHSNELETRLSNLECRCLEVSSWDEFQEAVESEPPEFAVVSLELAGRCSLQLCDGHAQLLNQIPVAFFAEDAQSSFEKSMAAIRLGAVDVITLPMSYEKLELISDIAQQQWRINRKLNTAEMHFESDSEVQDLTNDTASTAPPSPSSVFSSPLNVATTGDESPSIHPNGSVESSIFRGRWVSDYSSPSRLPAVSASTSENLQQNSTCPQALARCVTQQSKIKELETWILGSSPAMQSVRSIIAEVADTKANVMIYGASGTGKELVATAVHKLSSRCKGRFEPVNMTEIPHELAESLLFGHEKGAFTGADCRQIGVCEAADGGTLFLDEIGEMALATQPKLLRFLQEGSVKRIGSRTIKKVDVRVITATNRSPETIVKEGLMREDLFFRLHVVPIYIPPLKDRPEDIEQLAMLFLQRYVRAYNRTVEGFTKEALDVFRLHDWPGNVRQLENVVERLVVFAKGRLIDVPEIPAEIHAASMFGTPAEVTCQTESGSVLATAIHDSAEGQSIEVASAIASMSAIQRTERAAIIEALQRCDGHVIDAANMLGLGQATVYRKIKQYHIPHQRRRRRRSPK